MNEVNDVEQKNQCSLSNIGKYNEFAAYSGLNQVNMDGGSIYVMCVLLAHLQRADERILI